MFQCLWPDASTCWSTTCQSCVPSSPSSASTSRTRRTSASTAPPGTPTAIASAQTSSQRSTKRPCTATVSLHHGAPCKGRTLWQRLFLCTAWRYPRLAGCTGCLQNKKEAGSNEDGSDCRRISASQRKSFAIITRRRVKSIIANILYLNHPS